MRNIIIITDFVSTNQISVFGSSGKDRLIGSILILEKRKMNKDCKNYWGLEVFEHNLSIAYKVRR